MRRAQQAIDKAKEHAGYIINTKEEMIPTGRVEGEQQVWVNVAPLLEVNISKRRGRGKRV